MYSSISEFNKTFPFRRYIAELYNVADYERKKTFNIPCPFHSENSASCAIYEDSYFCYGASCGAHGSSFDFLTGQGLDRSQILNLDTIYVPVSVGENKAQRQKNGKIPSVLVKIYNQDLLNDDDKMQYVLNRHFDVESIKKSKIGYVYDIGKVFKSFEAPRYIIPVYDSQQNLITARYRIDPEHERAYQEEPKYLGHPNTNSALYNSHIIQDSDYLVVVGSEFDAAFLYYRYGIKAIAPPGEGNFRTEWAVNFNRQHNVLIWLDNDYAGISAAIKTYESLKSVCNAQIYCWDNSFKNKQDVCDFVDRYGIEGTYKELKKYGIEAHN